MPAPARPVPPPSHRPRTDEPSLSDLRSRLRRPPILILFGWLLILTGALTPFLLLHVEEFLAALGPSPVPTIVHCLVIAAAGALRVACGVGLLSGYEGSRLIWLLACFALAGFDVFAFPPTARTLVPSVLWPVFSLYVLFRPSVNDYFVAISSQNYPDLR